MCDAVAHTPTNTTCECSVTAVWRKGGGGDDIPGDFGAAENLQVVAGNTVGAYLAAASCFGGGAAAIDCLAAARDVLFAFAAVFGLFALSVALGKRRDKRDEVRRIRALRAAPALRHSLAVLRAPVVKEYVDFVLTVRRDAEAEALEAKEVRLARASKKDQAEDLASLERRRRERRRGRGRRSAADARKLMRVQWVEKLRHSRAARALMGLGRAHAALERGIPHGALGRAH